jgi:hypothetical protein
MRVHEVDHLPHRFALRKLLVFARLHQPEPSAPLYVDDHPEGA